MSHLELDLWMPPSSTAASLIRDYRENAVACATSAIIEIRHSKYFFGVDQAERISYWSLVRWHLLQLQGIRDVGD